eukprot:4828498-Pyramimonas_sp.AAC.1
MARLRAQPGHNLYGNLWRAPGAIPGPTSGPAPGAAHLSRRCSNFEQDRPSQHSYRPTTKGP